MYNKKCLNITYLKQMLQRTTLEMIRQQNKFSDSNIMCNVYNSIVLTKMHISHKVKKFQRSTVFRKKI